MIFGAVKDEQRVVPLFGYPQYHRGSRLPVLRTSAGGVTADSAVSVFTFDTPLLLTFAGFLVLMAVQASSSVHGEATGLSDTADAPAGGRIPASPIANPALRCS